MNLLGRKKLKEYRESAFFVTHIGGDSYEYQYGNSIKGLPFIIESDHIDRRSNGETKELIPNRNRGDKEDLKGRIRIEKQV